MRNNAWQPAGLEVVLDLSALFLADRAVVRSSDHRAAAAVAASGRARLGHHLRRRWKRVGNLAETLGVQIVEVGGEPLGQPPRVGEDNARAMLADQVENSILDVGPD